MAGPFRGMNLRIQNATGTISQFHDRPQYGKHGFFLVIRHIRTEPRPERNQTLQLNLQPPRIGRPFGVLDPLPRRVPRRQTIGHNQTLLSKLDSLPQEDEKEEWHLHERLQPEYREEWAAWGEDVMQRSGIVVPVPGGDDCQQKKKKQRRRRAQPAEQPHPRSASAFQPVIQQQRAGALSKSPKTASQEMNKEKPERGPRQQCCEYFHDRIPRTKVTRSSAPHPPRRPRPWHRGRRSASWSNWRVPGGCGSSRDTSA